MNIKYKLLKKQLNRLIRSAIRCGKQGGREICGLLVKNGYYIELVEAKNKSKRGGSFSFYYREIYAIERAVDVLGYEIIGTFHSHPVDIAMPGSSDIEDAPDNTYMLIISATDKEAVLWRVKDGRIRKVSYELLE